MAYRLMSLAAVVCALVLAISAVASAEPAAPGTVCHVKVVSDKVPDVTSLEAWKKAFIEPAKTNQDKGIAIWRSVITFQYQDSPPSEFLQHEGLVYDPIKMFNVYGYAMCSPHSAHMDALARSVGFPARGWGPIGSIVVVRSNQADRVFSMFVQGRGPLYAKLSPEFRLPAGTYWQEFDGVRGSTALIGLAGDRAHDSPYLGASELVAVNLDSARAAVMVPEAPGLTGVHPAGWITAP